MRLTLQHAYVVLGVSSNASSDQVRQAYRKLALQFHPDKNPDPTATEKFQQLSAAYKRICDHRSRRSSSFPNNNNNSGHGHGDSDGGFDFGDLYGDDEEDGDLDDMDISFEEMLMMFQMMFGQATHAKKAKTTKKKKSTKQATKGRAPPQVRVPTRRGGRKAPLERGGFMPSSMFGNAEEMMFQSFMTMEMAREMNDMEKEFKSMSSFFGRNFGDSDFSFGSDDEESIEGDLDDFVAFKKASGLAKQPTDTKSANHQKDPRQEIGNQEESSQETQEPGEDTLSESKPELPVAKDTSIALNAQVRVFGKHTGVVKFKGSVHYAKGDFLGVQLREPLGKNDGTIKGVAYFECPAHHGLMVRPEDVGLVV